MQKLAAYEQDSMMNLVKKESATVYRKVTDTIAEAS